MGAMIAGLRRPSLLLGHHAGRLVNCGRQGFDGLCLSEHRVSPEDVRKVSRIDEHRQLLRRRQRGPSDFSSAGRMQRGDQLFDGTGAVLVRGDLDHRIQQVWIDFQPSVSRRPEVRTYENRSP